MTRQQRLGWMLAFVLSHVFGALLGGSFARAEEHASVTVARSLERIANALEEANRIARGNR